MWALHNGKVISSSLYTHNKHAYVIDYTGELTPCYMTVMTTILIRFSYLFVCILQHLQYFHLTFLLYIFRFCFHLTKMLIRCYPWFKCNLQEFIRRTKVRLQITSASHECNEAPNHKYCS